MLMVVVVWEVVLHVDDGGVGGCNMLMMMMVVWEVVLHADDGDGVRVCTASSL